MSLILNSHFQEIPYHFISMDFGVEMDGSQDFFQMFWPVVVSESFNKLEFEKLTQPAQ